MVVPRFHGHERCIRTHGRARLTDTYRGVLTTSVSYLTRRSVSGWVRTADRRRAGAERSTFRWLPSTPLDRPTVTGEGHVVALEDGGG
jgi:hypothetical protein